MKDTRLTYNFERIAHEENVWDVDAKLDVATGRVKVYRVYGDITNQQLLDEAIELHFGAVFAGVREDKTHQHYATLAAAGQLRVVAQEGE